MVHFSTRVPGAANLTAFRISELCGATSSYSYDDSPRRRTCEPDNLYNHDSGSLLADVLFINGAGGSGLEPDFNGSVISRYCVSRVDRPYADYVSCNGKDTEHYACACNLFIDRCIGRLNTSSCSYSGPKRFMPDCHCSDASREASAQYIGKMPAFFPFPEFHHKAPFPAECSPVLVPPISESVRMDLNKRTCSSCRKEAIARHESTHVSHDTHVTADEQPGQKRQHQWRGTWRAAGGAGSAPARCRRSSRRT